MASSSVLLLHYPPRICSLRCSSYSSSVSSSDSKLCRNSLSSCSSSSSSHSCSASSSWSWFLDSRRGLNLSILGFGGIEKICCNQRLKAHGMSTTPGNLASPKGIANSKDEPDHLLVLVHGIFSSHSDWKYFEAELKKRLGKNFLIYASSCNSYTKTLTGIDGAGKRLADEVMQVVKRTKSLKKISFLAHSLGGMFSRYAIGMLYNPNDSVEQLNEYDSSLTANQISVRFSSRGSIAGLDPINFITLATPHLGVRGRRQLPFLLGIALLEKIAAPLAPMFARITGSQLFLTDGKPDKPPLLLRMASDCEEGKFISALGAFRSRVLYANVSFDHMVGWRTSSIRRETELVKPPMRSLDGYKHVVDVQYCEPVSAEGPHFPRKAVEAKEAVQQEPNKENTLEYYDIVEEEMIRGLQQLGWKKVDVSFHSAIWPLLAHNNIHVKNDWLHKAGAGVVAHVVETIRQQETEQDLHISIPAKL